jgi:AcrR family transcriptional regulator
MPSETHPTAIKLLDTVSTMLDGDHPNEIFVDDVLHVSGVSRGSLYHHFGDYPALIRATLVRRFSANVDADSATMMAVAETATSKDDYWNRIRALSAATQVPERAPVRAERARLISLVSSDPQFARALAAEQDRLTNSMGEAIAVAQRKGWVNQILDPRAVATFLQAYSLGRAVDDVAENPLNNEAWLAVIDTVIASLKEV